MARNDDTEPSKIGQPSVDKYHAEVEKGIALFRLQRTYWAVGPGPDHVPIRRDNDLVASNFPGIGERIRSPAFLWPDTIPAGFLRGSESPTDAATSDRFVRGIADRNPWLQQYTLSFLSEDGHNFSYMMLSTSPVRLEGYTQSSSKLRIWIQSGVHGNEPAGDQAVLALLGKMDQDPSWTDSILTKIDILILPRYNPDGIADFNRPCMLGIDLNRDHIRLQVPQSRHIRRLFCRFKPHIALDMHEYSAKARYSKQYIHGSDVMFAAAKNINISARIREISETLFVANISLSLQAAGFRSEPYIPISDNVIVFKEASSDGKIGRNAMGLTQCVSFLCETRGIGIADQHFHRRTAAGLKFLESVLETSITNTDLIRSTIDASVDRFIHSDDDVVVRDEATTHLDRNFTMIDIRTGQLLQLPVKLLSSTPTISVLARTRPEAYILPRYSSVLAQRLTELGLHVDVVEHELDVVVEVLTVLTAVFDQTYFEGVVPMRATTRMDNTRKKMSDGAFLISTRQRNAALAFIALEPENIDSYVSTNIIPVVAGEEYPVYRLLRSVEQ